VVLASRVLVGGALAGGMPRWKYLANRMLTAVENLAMGAHLSEFHTGYRAYSRRALQTLPLANNRNDYVFDSEILAQAIEQGLPIGEISCPAHYFDEMQTITFGPGVRYGLGVLGVAARVTAHHLGKKGTLLDPHAPGLSAWSEGAWSVAPTQER
jgi:hypothetical protein